MRRLSLADSALCPHCLLHTSQGRIGRGVRYCGRCGQDFTLEEARKAQAEIAQPPAVVGEESNNG